MRTRGGEKPGAGDALPALHRAAFPSPAHVHVDVVYDSASPAPIVVFDQAADALGGVMEVRLANDGQRLFGLGSTGHPMIGMPNAVLIGVDL